jgi:malonate transporter and related proteins
MLSTVLGALLPIVITMLLGFIAAWHHDFEEEHASTLNRMVLRYAFPMSLCTGTFLSLSRSVLPSSVCMASALW